VAPHRAPYRAGFAVVFFLTAVLLASCFSDPARPVFEAAERDLGAGAFHEAISGYAYVASEFPSSSYAPKSQYMVASIYNRHLSDPASALRAYSTLISVFPRSREAWLAKEDMARLYSRMGDHWKAVDAFQALLETRPGERDKFLYLIAMEYVMMDDFRQARVELVELLDAASDARLIPEIMYRIAETYYIEGSLEKAMEAFDELISRYPENRFSLEARLGKARALTEIGSLTEALGILKGLEDEYTNREAIRTQIASIEKLLREGPSLKKRRRRRRRRMLRSSSSGSGRVRQKARKKVRRVVKKTPPETVKKAVPAPPVSGSRAVGAAKTAGDADKGTETKEAREPGTVKSETESPAPPVPVAPAVESEPGEAPVKAAVPPVVKDNDAHTATDAGRSKDEAALPEGAETGKAPDAEAAPGAEADGDHGEQGGGMESLPVRE